MSRATQCAPVTAFETVRFTRMSAGSDAQWLKPDVPSQNAWFGDAVRRIQSYAELPDNWNTYGATRPVDEAIAAATLLLSVIGSQAGSIIAPFIAPTSEGFVHFEWNKDEMALEVDVTESGLAQYVLFEADEVVRQGSQWPSAFREILPFISFFAR